MRANLSMPDVQAHVDHEADSGLGQVAAGVWQSSKRSQRLRLKAVASIPSTSSGQAWIGNRPEASPAAGHDARRCSGRVRRRSVIPNAFDAGAALAIGLEFGRQAVSAGGVHVGGVGYNAVVTEKDLAFGFGAERQGAALCPERAASTLRRKEAVGAAFATLDRLR